MKTLPFIIPVYLLVLFHSHFCHAQNSCHPIKISENSAPTTCLPTSVFIESDTLTSYYIGFELNEIMPRCELNIEFDYLVDDITVEFYKESDVNCWSIGNAIGQKKINDLNEHIDLDLHLNSTTGSFVARVKREGGSSMPRFEVNLINYDEQAPCTRGYHRINSITEPLGLNPFGSAIRLNEEGCNRWCKRTATPISGILSSETPRLKWYEIQTAQIGFFDLEVISRLNDVEPLVWVVVEDRDEFRLISKHEGASQRIDLQYYPAFFHDKILIGIGSSSSPFIDFNLKLKSYDRTMDCIDFLPEENGDTLYVRSTSFGSSHSGPFLEGEEVEFCYEIHNWFPIEHNWIQGITPEFGSGWDASSFDSIHAGLPAIMTYSDTAHHNGYWKWHGDEEAEIEIGIPGGEYKGPGWYFISNQYHVDEHFKYAWGRENPTYRDRSDPLYQICFTLKTTTLIDCNSPLSADIKIKVHSDVVTGVYNSIPCMSAATIFESEIRCCDTIKELLVQEEVICEGETNQLTVVGGDNLQVTWYKGGPEFGNILGAGNSLEFLAPSIESELEEIEIVAIGIDAQGHCSDTAQASFAISKKPNFTLPQSLTFCAGDDVVISPTLEEVNGHEIVWAWEEISFSQGRSGLMQQDMLLTGQLNESARFRLIGTNDNSCSMFQDIDLITQPYYDPGIESVYSICDDAIFLDLESADATLEWRPEDTQETWHALQPDNQFGEGNYLLRSTTSENCHLEMPFEVRKGTTTDSLLIAVCNERQDIQNNDSRSEGQHTFYYFKAADCPNGDTVLLYDFYTDCDSETTKYRGFNIIKIESISNEVLVYPNPPLDGYINIVDFEEDVERICLYSTLTAKLIACEEKIDREVRMNIHDLLPGPYSIIGYSVDEKIRFISTFIK